MLSQLRLYFKLANTTTYWQETILFWTPSFWTLVSTQKNIWNIQKRIQKLDWKQNIWTEFLHSFYIDSKIWHIWELITHCIAFRHFHDLIVKQLCLDPSFAFLHTLSPHDTIFTKHQAFVPSGPMLLSIKYRMFRAEFCFKALARAWQETNDLRNTMKPKAHIPQSCENLPVALLISKLRFQMVSGITNIANNERRWLINDTLHWKFSDLLHSANLTYCTAWLKQWLHY